ncbi:MAG: outer membrane protein assembly factor BamA [Elusimicrobiota bacterium]
MKKRIIIMVILSVFVCFVKCHKLFAQEVKDIEIQGNKNVPAADIKEKISLRSGEEYSPKKAGKDISAIYEMGRFDDVSVSLEEVSTGTVKIIYRVEEKPLIRKIEIKGNEEIKSGKVKKQIQLEENGYFDKFEMPEDVDRIKKFYKEEGFAECEVDAYHKEAEEGNEVVVTYFIKEGNKIKIAEINLIGVVKENYKKIKKQIESKEGKKFNQNKIEQDKEKIIKYYKNNGYLNTEIDGPVLTYGKERKNIYITYFVYEDSKYYIKDISFEGNQKIKDKEIKQAIGIEKGQIYSREEIEKAMMSIQEVYGKKGYIKMGVIPHYSYDEKDKMISVDFEINEGPKVYIRNIYLDGNVITKDYVIRRKFKVKKGEPFNLQQVRRTQAEIYKLGFFSDVKVDMLPAGSPDKIDLVFVVREQKTGMASIGAGYSSQDKLVGTVRVSQDNLFGRGQKLSAMWEFGKEKQNYRIDFSEPYFFNTPTPFNFSIYNTVRTRYYKDGDYKEQRRGGSLTGGRHFTDELSVFLKYSLEQVKIHGVGSAIEDEIDEEKDTTSSITPTVSFDSRDYPFNPRKGYYASISNQVAGGIFGGDRDFVKTELKTTYFQPLVKKFTGVVNLNLGSVLAYSDSPSVPIYEKFNVGGAESLRGYDYWGEVGPPEGGNYKLVGNLEIKFPIVSEQGQTILQGAVFYDIGSAWNSLEDIELNSGVGENKLKRGFGVGIRFKTRAFPIRLDWGYGIDKRPKDSQWYFTIGDIF